MNHATIERSTPIFDSVMADQGVEMMPLPATPTHQEFLAAHGHSDWLARVLREPVLGDRPATPLRPVPTKRKGKR